MFAFNFYELQYLRGLFWKNCLTRPQNCVGLKGKSKKKAVAFPYGKLYFLPNTQEFFWYKIS